MMLSVHKLLLLIIPLILVILTGITSLIILTNNSPQSANAQAGGTPPPVLAFPTAEGFGAQSIGGRGGQVIEVTNLNDSGPGSLRAAIGASGKRLVVFRVAGTITLLSRLDIDNPFITIAGQTAPGDGITLRTDPSLADPLLLIRTHDVIIRYMRFRPGPNTLGSYVLDAIGVENANVPIYNIIVDHSSLSWATDETLSVWFPFTTNVTFQWNIISEALHCSTYKPVGSTEFECFSSGVIFGGGTSNISFHHNLLAHNVVRNPRISSGTHDIVNNVIYNPGDSGSWGASHVTSAGANPTRVNYVGNYFKPGQDTSPTNYYISGCLAGGTSYNIQLFVKGNITPLRVNDTMNELVGVVRPSEYGKVVTTPHSTPAVTTTTALQAYNDVLAQAGASTRVDCNGASVLRRDSVDLRIVEDVENGTGTLLDDPSQQGGWPVLATGTACADTDHDGIPNTWETSCSSALGGLSNTNGSDGAQTVSSTGYTKLEHYLNEVAGDYPAGSCGGLAGGNTPTPTPGSVTPTPGTATSITLPKTLTAPVIDGNVSEYTGAPSINITTSSGTTGT
jgi:pectate lyase